eukprot:gene680-1302_t
MSSAQQINDLLDHLSRHLEYKQSLSTFELQSGNYHPNWLKFHEAPPAEKFRFISLSLNRKLIKETIISMVRSSFGSNILGCDFLCLASQLEKLLSFEPTVASTSGKGPRKSTAKLFLNTRIKTDDACLNAYPVRFTEDASWLLNNLSLSAASIDKLESMDNTEDAVLINPSTFICFDSRRFECVVSNLSREPRALSICRTDESVVDQCSTNDNASKVQTYAPQEKTSTVLEDLVVTSLAAFISMCIIKSLESIGERSSPLLSDMTIGMGMGRSMVGEGWSSAYLHVAASSFELRGQHLISPRYLDGGHHQQEQEHHHQLCSASFFHKMWSLQSETQRRSLLTSLGLDAKRIVGTTSHDDIDNTSTLGWILRLSLFLSDLQQGKGEATVSPNLTPFLASAMLEQVCLGNTAGGAVYEALSHIALIDVGDARRRGMRKQISAVLYTIWLSETEATFLQTEERSKVHSPNQTVKKRKKKKKKKGSDVASGKHNNNEIEVGVEVEGEEDEEDSGRGGYLKSIVKGCTTASLQEAVSIPVQVPSVQMTGSPSPLVLETVVDVSGTDCLLLQPTVLVLQAGGGDGSDSPPYDTERDSGSRNECSGSAALVETFVDDVAATTATAAVTNIGIESDRDGNADRDEDQEEVVTTCKGCNDECGDDEADLAIIVPTEVVACMEFIVSCVTVDCPGDATGKLVNHNGHPSFLSFQFSSLLTITESFNIPLVHSIDEPPESGTGTVTEDKSSEKISRHDDTEAAVVQFQFRSVVITDDQEVVVLPNKRYAHRFTRTSRDIDDDDDDGCEQVLSNNDEASATCPCVYSSESEDSAESESLAHQASHDPEGCNDALSTVNNHNHNPLVQIMSSTSSSSRDHLESAGGIGGVGMGVGFIGRRPKSIPRVFTGLVHVGGEPDASPLDLLLCDRQFRITDRLSADIVDMSAQLRALSAYRQSWQATAVERLKYVVGSLWPQAVVNVFGSCFTELAVPASDVDVVISGLPHSYRSRSLSGRGGIMNQLSDALSRQIWVNSVQLLDKAVMPIIKITTGPTLPPQAIAPEVISTRRGLVRMDISFDMHGGDGSTSLSYSKTASFSRPHPPCSPHRGLASRDFMVRLCTINPSLAPLVVVLKQLLLERGLLDPFTGGLSSYAVAIMVGSLLKPHSLEPPETHPDLGSLLLTFLSQFGTLFDTQRFAVCMSTRGPLVPLVPTPGSSGGWVHAHVPRVGSPDYWRASDPVVVLDPLDPSNNLGRNCFGFRHIQAQFDAALRSVERYVSEGGLDREGDHRSVLGALFSASHHQCVVRLAAQMWCPEEFLHPPFMQLSVMHPQQLPLPLATITNPMTPIPYHSALTVPESFGYELPRSEVFRTSQNTGGTAENESQLRAEAVELLGKMSGNNLRRVLQYLRGQPRHDTCLLLVTTGQL